MLEAINTLLTMPLLVVLHEMVVFFLLVGIQIPIFLDYFAIANNVLGCSLYVYVGVLNYFVYLHGLHKCLSSQYSFFKNILHIIPYIALAV